MAERAGGEVDARHDVLGVGAERAAVGAERREQCLIDQPALVQRRVERERGVTLGEHEPVAVVVVERREVQDAAVEGSEHVDDRKRGTDVADTGGGGALDHVAPDAGREGVQVVFGAQRI